MILVLILGKDYKAELERVKRQIYKVSQQIKKLERKEKDYLNRVELLERKENLLESYIIKLRMQEKALRGRLRHTEAALKRLRREKGDVLEKLKKGINLLYLLKEPSVWEFIFNANRAYAYYEKAMITESMIYAYKNSLEQIGSFEREYRTLRDRRLELLQEINSNIKEQESAIKELQETKENLSKEIEKIKKDKRKKKRYLARLERRKKELERIIRKLVKKKPKRKLFPKGKVLLWPVRGRIVRKFGYYTDPKYGVRIKNNGVDIKAEPGSDVIASIGGKVVYSGYLEGYGNVVIIEGKGLYIIYGNLMDIFVGVDKRVRKGMKIGTVGNKPLHFEVREGTKPVNPLKYLP